MKEKKEIEKLKKELDKLKKKKYKAYSYKLNEKTEKRLREKFEKSKISWNLLFVRLLDNDDAIIKKIKR
jgi:hypothetical protein